MTAAGRRQLAQGRRKWETLVGAIAGILSPHPKAELKVEFVMSFLKRIFHFEVAQTRTGG